MDFSLYPANRGYFSHMALAFVKVCIRYVNDFVNAKSHVPTGKKPLLTG